MKGISIVCFLVLGVSTIFEYCEARKITTTTIADVDLPKNWKKSYKYAFKYMHILSDALKDVTAQLDKIKELPSLDILRIVNNDPNYKSTKADLDGVSEVPIGRECAERLQGQVHKFVKQYIEGQKVYNKTIDDMEEKMQSMENDLTDASYGVTVTLPTLDLEKCNGEHFCELAIKNIEKFEVDLELVKSYLRWINDQNENKRSLTYIAKSIDSEVIRPVQDCLDKLKLKFSN